MTEQSRFCCDLGVFTPAQRERHQALTRKLAGAGAERKELPDGYAFRLRAEVVSVAELVEWVSGERKCCPFFDFEIVLERDGGPLWLKLRGADGVKPFIRSELGMRP